MIENSNIRWHQRLSNYEKALKQLQNAVNLSQERSLSEIEKQGLLKAFEFTHELAWNVMKDYFDYQGNTTIRGSRDAIREAFSVGLISEGEIWMDTIKSRTISVHTYDESTANEIASKIINQYIKIFQAFYIKMNDIKKEL